MNLHKRLSIKKSKTKNTKKPKTSKIRKTSTETKSTKKKQEGGIINPFSRKTTKTYQFDFYIGAIL